MPPAASASNHLDPLDSRTFDSDFSAKDEPTPAQSAPSENENPSISTLPIQADADLLPVVGLGGSAGSIAALQGFFDLMPPNSGLAFVVVLHLSPDFESQLREVLQSHTAMPVVSVGERVRAEANHVYVIPPGQHLEMADGDLHLTPMENEFGKRVAVDLFFRSLAASQRSRAVAVVLSGLDSDGSIGIKRIKEHGGVTIAQDPDEAAHDGMPRSAIQTGMVDWVLPISDLAPRLVEFWNNEKRIQLPPGEPSDAVNSVFNSQNGSKTTLKDADEIALREILAFLLARTGHDFAHYKRATVLRRIGRRLQVNSLANLPDYVAFLRTHGGEAGALLQDLLISVTNFFRDPEAFAALEERIPALFRGKKAGDSVRVWVAGCATGEEAYSVAMLLVEHAGTLVSPPTIQVFATDIDEEATRAAREGRFTQAIAADVSPERLRRFFLLDHGHYRVRAELREIVLFASHNILRDSPFSHLDLVACRNLLIYFQPPAQEQVLAVFHFALNPDGLLFLGGSETSDESEGLFAALDKKHRIYERRGGNRRPLHLASVPTPRPIALPDAGGLTRAAAPPSAAFSLHERGRVAPDFGELHLRLLEQWSPPSVLVTHNFDIVHLSERAGRFIAFRGGAVSTHLPDVVHPALRLELRAALMSALQDGQSVDVPDLPLEIEGLPRIVDLRVRPLRDEDNSSGAVSYLLVVFDDREARGAEAVLERASDDAAVLRLERETGHLKAHLRSTVEQYEAMTEELKASNEELQAMNEELRSAGEELETSKEELQAANEELLTVNQEMKSNVEQLAHSNGDLQNLMAATSIATIFLDRELRIQRYTPPAAPLFNLIATDIQRPLSDLRHSLHYDEMLRDAAQVMEQLLPVEREISSEDGRHFLVRVRAYRSVEDRIDGVVFTFVDVSRRHEAEAELRRSEERYRSLFTSIEEAFALCEIILDEEGKPEDYRLLEVNPAFARATGISPLIADTRTARELVLELEEWQIEIYGRVALGGEAKRFQHRVAEPNRWFETFASPVGEHGNGKFALISRDITPRKQQEEELSRLNAHIERQIRLFDTTLSSISDFAYIFGRDGRFVYSNRPLLDLLGITLEEIVGKNFFDLGYLPQLAARLQGEIQQVFETAQIVRAETSFESPSGAGGFYEYIFNPIFGEGGAVEAVAGSTRDVTQRKHAELSAEFLAEISLDLVRGGDAEMTQTVTAKLGAFLNLSGCAWLEIDAEQDEARVHYSWHREGEASLASTYRLGDLISGEWERACRAGETFVARDTQSDARADAQRYAAVGARALASVPLAREEQWRFLLLASDSAPREWRDGEINLIQEVAARLWTRLERARAETERRELEERYHTLFNSIDEGFYLAEIVWDKAGTAADVRYLDENPAAIAMLGRRAKGDLLSEINPDYETYWRDMFTRTAQTGEAQRLERFSAPDGLWFDFYVFKPEGVTDGSTFGVLFRDVTPQKRRALHAEFLAKISQDLVNASSSEAIMQGVGAKIGAFFGLSVCAFLDVDETTNHATITHNWHLEGAPSLLGTYQLDEYLNGDFASLSRAGETFVVADTQEDGRVDAARYRAIGVGAFASIPVVRGGKWLFQLVAYAARARAWNADEIELLREVTARIWTSIERRRADELLRQSEARLVQLLDSIDEGFALIDPVLDAQGETIDLLFVETNPAFALQTGVANAAGQTVRELIPNVENFWFETYEQVVSTGESARFERFIPAWNRSFDVFASRVGQVGSRRVAIVFQNISARQLATELLRESEERFRAMFEQANVGIVQVALGGEIIAPNPGFCNIIGYDEAQARGLSVRGITHPDDYEREAALTRQLIAGEIPGYSIEKRFIRKGGGIVWAEMTATLMRDAGRAPIFLLSVIEDISERKAAQDAVREREERLQVLLDSVQDYAIITITPENKIETWNPGAEKIFGWSESEVLGKSGVILFTPEDREKGAPEAEIALARREGRAADERWHIRKDGSRFYASGVMTALRDDSRHGFVKILRDLTAQKQAEELLRASEARFRTQADAIPQIIWTNEPNGVANGFNKRWFDFSGLTLGESYGLGWQKIVHPDDATSAMHAWQAALDAGEIFETQYRLRDREGRYRWHIARNVPLHGDGGQVLGWFGTATDIQDLKDAQEELRQSRDLLEQRVQERTQSLQERTRALQEEVVERQRLENQARELMQRIVRVQEEERRRLSRELHDNLGQHASAILLSLQLLQDAETNPIEGGQSAAQLDRLHRQMNELLDMTHRLAWELRPAVLDNVGLEAALRQYVAEWLRHGIEAEFVSRLPENEAGRAEIGLLPDAETALYRVVQEALTNVVRHAGATMASVVLERRSDYVTAIVEDNGRGFDAEAIAVSKRLGMRGMQERMELVGGTLEVESQPGMGTTIYARVPLDAAD